jgi:hypothetical protein
MEDEFMRGALFILLLIIKLLDNSKITKRMDNGFTKDIRNP